MNNNDRWSDFNKIVDTLELDIKEKGLLLILFRYVNYKTGYANPSRSLIKKKSGISDNRTLDKIFDSLIEKGFLIRERGKGVRSKYFIKVGVEKEPGGEFTPSVNITLTPSGEITPSLGGEITPQKEKRKKTKEKSSTSLDMLIAEYTQNEYLRETLKDFLKMRKAIKKTMTDRALKIILKKLKGFSNDENIQIKILEQSILNSWQGIFPLKKDNTPANKNIEDMF